MMIGRLRSPNDDRRVEAPNHGYMQFNGLGTWLLPDY